MVTCTIKFSTNLLLVVGEQAKMTKVTRELGQKPITRIGFLRFKRFFSTRFGSPRPRGQVSRVGLTSCVGRRRLHRDFPSSCISARTTTEFTYYKFVVTNERLRQSYFSIWVFPFFFSPMRTTLVLLSTQT